MILAEYDIVATGLKTLDRQLAGWDNPLARFLASQLAAVTQKLGLDREAMAQF